MTTTHQITTPLIREGSLFPALCVAIDHPEPMMTRMPHSVPDSTVYYPFTHFCRIHWSSAPDLIATDVFSPFT